ncbi:hypothetical protein GMORB2_0912 [Geosmithia morbida]|uniref:SacI domain protein n=1 Tax=Geosmithia morbida TaxID=1094350 RepID=A0A9P4Z1Q2_9HYPO|nr:uncharacterized protein GMORB2_0912 [Geosmithia morbida]KAF4125668.1 hypothetical protein GMORB2_0912 [Geosmithia morbida]
MPGLARKVVICTATDGLVIQPRSAKGQRPFQTLCIKYGSDVVSLASPGQTPEYYSDDDDSSFEAFGIIGLITVSKLSYLVSITRRQQVAQVDGSPIYVVTDVALTPCASKAEAQESIRKTQQSLSGPVASDDGVGDDDDSSDDDDGVDPRSSDADDDVDDAVVLTFDDGLKNEPRSPEMRVAQDVFNRRGSYGGFAQSWFSRNGWTVGKKPPLGISNSPTMSPTPSPIKTPEMSTLPPSESLAPAASPEEVTNLIPKLLQMVQVYFGSSRSFYFAYDFDLTRSLARRTEFPLNPEIPLYSQVDDVFFWNRNLMLPFLNAGHESVSLPLLQGFVGQRSFIVDSNPPQVDDLGVESVELSNLQSPAPVGSTSPEADDDGDVRRRDSEKSYTITLISRRSTQRAGLRYLRRGVNQDGSVANMVETEQLLSPTESQVSSPQTRSYLQVRGSIPLFFSQTPYSLKPVPVLQHSEETNRQACRKHFDRLRRTYGEIQIVNLVEKHGVEAAIGTRYEHTVDYLNRLTSEQSEVGPSQQSPGPLSFEWFDFHRACRGMKFENVNLLLSRLRDQIEHLGSARVRDGKVVERQKGIIRTNCMDCLDRTNVCQSSFARHMLDLQLKEDGFDMSAQVDQQSIWFNTLWADNGDAISKQYASTAAMKGDYTRTKKRDYRGALNDLGLSLARFYSGMVNDYFSQTAIDFLLGNVNDKVFEEFEADMKNKDPAISMTKMREQAVELCQKRVVADEDEEFHGGWALLTPNVSNTIKTLPMEEVVLLLTDAAVYLCRFDWNMDKVSSFERVNLANITGIRVGTYITSTISTSQADPSKNVGFVVTYQPGKSDITRTNTRTLSSRDDLAPEPGDGARPMSLIDGLFGGVNKEPPLCRLAFKVPYVDSSTVAIGGASQQQTEEQQASNICAEMERLVLECRVSRRDEKESSIIERSDIISLEEARRNTGLLEQLGHSIKKLVWA